MQTIELTKIRLNPELSVEGILFTMYDQRTNLSQEVVSSVKEGLGQREKIFNVIIPRNIKLAEAPSHGIPICLYDSKSSGAIAYNELAIEILKNDSKIGNTSVLGKKNDDSKKTKGRTKTNTGNSKRAARKKVVIDKIKEKKEKQDKQV